MAAVLFLLAARLKCPLKVFRALQTHSLGDQDGGPIPKEHTEAKDADMAEEEGEADVYVPPATGEKTCIRDLWPFAYPKASCRNRSSATFVGLSLGLGLERDTIDCMLGAVGQSLT